MACSALHGARLLHTIVQKIGYSTNHLNHTSLEHGLITEATEGQGYHTPGYAR